MTLEDYRIQLRNAYRALKEHGDENLYLFEGTEMLGEELAQLLPDQLPPRGGRKVHFRKGRNSPSQTKI